MLQVRIPFGIPPLGVYHTDVLGCPGHPAINGNLEVEGNVAAAGRLERISVSSLDAESSLHEKGVLLEAVDGGLLGIQKDNGKIRIQGHLLFYSAPV